MNRVFASIAGVFSFAFLTFGITMMGAMMAVDTADTAAKFYSVLAFFATFGISLLLGWLGMKWWRKV